MSCFLHLPMLIRSDLVNGLVQFGDDMKAVQNMNGLSRLFFDDLEIRLPHIGTNELQCLASLLTKKPEKTEECLHRPVFANP